MTSSYLILLPLYIDIITHYCYCSIFVILAITFYIKGNMKIRRNLNMKYENMIIKKKMSAKY